ncbi:MAG TPA: hypothetical protein VGA07_10275 [Anaerolineales bacterium]
MPKKSNRGLWIGLGVGCLALLLCGAVAAVLFFGGFLSFLGTTAPVIENVIPQIEGNLDELDNAFGAPTGIQIGVIGPGTVTVGETFNLQVRVTNTSAEAQTLDSIDFGEEYLAGISILSADPSFSDSFEYPGFYSYTFERSIPAGGELAVQFQAQAEQSGDFEGPLDICINSPVNCLNETVSTSVSP